MTHRQRYDLPPSRYDLPPATPAKRRLPIAGLAVVGVLVMVTVLILVNALTGGKDDEHATDQAESHDVGHHHEEGGETGPTPGSAQPGLDMGELPPGGPYTQEGSGTYRTVGTAGDKVGEGTEKTFTYVVEVEDTIDASQYGGDDAFAAMIDATLANPKSWIADKRFAFQHVDANTVKKPDFRFQLTAASSTHQLCGNSYRMETSCFYPPGGRVVINESRWIRGAQPYEGDTGGYRQYVINHELGHGIGYAHHQQCGGDGQLAPVMMQQSLSLNNSELHAIDPDEVYEDNHDTCRPNPWPYPNGKGS